VQTQNGAAYGYLDPGSRPNMTAVGLLCRAYLGWGPKNPAMIAGVENLRRLAEEIGGRASHGHHVAGLEPSCASRALAGRENVSMRSPTVYASR